MPSSRPAPGGAAGSAIAALRDEAEQVALRLSGDDTDADLQELGDALARLEENSADLAKSARGAWRSRLGEARKHFHEARDLLDDGEPADAVALEVMAGREGLRN